MDNVIGMTERKSMYIIAKNRGYEKQDIDECIRIYTGKDIDELSPDQFKRIIEILRTMEVKV